MTCTSADLLLLKKNISNSNKDKNFCEESSVTPEQVKTCETPSKHQRQTYLKKSIEKKVSKSRQFCQLCNQSKNIPWIGCDYEGVNGKTCKYWVQALSLGFPDAEDETFENISFHCPRHNRANIASASSKKKKSSSLWKLQQLNCILLRESTNYNKNIKKLMRIRRKIKVAYIYNCQITQNINSFPNMLHLLFNRGVSRTTATSKMELYVALVNG